MNMWILSLKILTMLPDCDSVTQGRFRSTAATAKLCLASTPWTWAMCNQSSWLKIILLVATGPCFTCIDCYSRRSATACFCLLVWICVDVWTMMTVVCNPAKNKQTIKTFFAVFCCALRSQWFFLPKTGPWKGPLQVDGKPTPQWLRRSSRMPGHGCSVEVFQFEGFLGPRDMLFKSPPGTLLGTRHSRVGPRCGLQYYSHPSFEFMDRGSWRFEDQRCCTQMMAMN